MIFCFFAENALKTFKKYAFPMQKMRKICIGNAKNRKNLQCQCKKQKKLALLKQKIKKNAFPMEKKIALTS